jgi:hypothetical protein
VQVCHGVASRSRRYGATTFAVDGERRLVTQIFTSWNPTAGWLRRLGAFQRADEHNQSGISPGGRLVLEFKH